MLVVVMEFDNNHSHLIIIVWVDVSDKLIKPSVYNFSIYIPDGPPCLQQKRILLVTYVIMFSYLNWKSTFWYKMSIDFKAQYLQRF